VWDSRTGNLLRQLDCSVPDETQFPGHTERIAFTQDSKGLIAGGTGPQVFYYDLTKEGERRCFAGHRGRVFSVSVSPDGKRFATAGADTTGIVWEAPQR
jgi:WD40 repeat protein